MTGRPAAVLLALASALLLLTPGCRPAPAAGRVVLYCAHDREFADNVLRQFTRETGIDVVTRYDTEANKSVGLYEDLLREAVSPRCDVHWNNEILNTIRLTERGVLTPYASPAAAPYPARYKAADHTWTAFAARARVLLVNTDLVKEADRPRALTDLTRPEWKGRVAMARPLFGTTATQAACLFQAWGPDRAAAFYRGLRANGVHLAAGNKQVAVGVGSGQFAIGLTDTDDAVAEVAAGRPVALVFPDRDAPADGDRGVLFIPNTVAVVKGGPNPAAARALVDYLLSPAVEAALARSASRQIPLNPHVPLDGLAPVETPRTVRPLPVDFAAAAAAWPAAQQFLVAEFGRR